MQQTNNQTPQQYSMSANATHQTNQVLNLKTLMTELAPAMTLYCPDFAKRFGDKHVENAMREYANQLFQRNMSLTDFRRGIERMKYRKAKWTPTPTEFVELCQLQAEDFGFPTEEQVLSEVESFNRHSAKGSSKPFKFSGHFAQLVALDISNSLYTFRRANDEKREAMVKKAYGKWLDYQRTHGFLPQPAERLSRTSSRNGPTEIEITARRQGIDLNSVPNPFAEQIERIRQDNRKSKRGRM